MSNLWATFKRLLPSTPLLIGEVIAHNDDGTSRIQLPGGGKITARGTGVAVGSNAYVRAGLIEGEAPDLTEVEIEV
jgi:hypothetical protein